MAGWNGALVTMLSTTTGHSRKKEAGVPAEFAAEDTARVDLFRKSPPPCSASDEPVTLPPQLLACLDDMTIGSAVLRHAAALARGLGLSVAVAHVVEAPREASPADPLAWQVVRRETRERLVALLGILGRKGAAAEPILLNGTAADELIRWAREHDSLLMALGTHGAGETGTSLGTTTQRIIERSQSSVLLVPSPAACFDDRYRRIFVPLDGSCRAESVLPIAMRIARAHEAELILAHVVPEARLTIPTVDQGDDFCTRLTEKNERDARDYLDALRTKLWKERLPVRTVVVANGDARPQLRQLAVHHRADLMIISSHGRSGMADIACGSVAEYLVTHAPIPLFLVRPTLAEALAAAGSLTEPPHRAAMPIRA